MSRFKLLVAPVLGFTLLITIGCFGRTSVTPSSTIEEVVKPKPVVETISAATSGMLDNYYAILDITVKNDGADGTVVVVASVTQGEITNESEFPLYITHNSKQAVKMIFPLIWKGGDWTPNVYCEVP